MDKGQNQKLAEKLKIFNKILLSDSFAHVASILNNGSPHVTPVWFNYDETELVIRITTFKNSQKNKNFKRNKSVALSILDNDNPYCYIQIQGKIISSEIDKNSKFSNYLTKKYSNGKQTAYPKDEKKNIMVYTIKPKKITGWNPKSAEEFYNWMNGT